MPANFNLKGSNFSLPNRFISPSNGRPYCPPFPISPHGSSPRQASRRPRHLGQSLRGNLGKSFAMRSQCVLTETLQNQTGASTDDEDDPIFLDLLQARWIFRNEQSPSVYAWAGSLLMPKFLPLLTSKELPNEFSFLANFLILISSQLTLNALRLLQRPDLCQSLLLHAFPAPKPRLSSTEYPTNNLLRPLLPPSTRPLRIPRTLLSFHLAQPLAPTFLPKNLLPRTPPLRLPHPHPTNRRLKRLSPLPLLEQFPTCLVAPAESAPLSLPRRRPLPLNQPPRNPRPLTVSFSRSQLAL
jgi:hypothetical protein